MSQLRLDSKVRLKDSESILEVGEILQRLEERYPEGFYSIEGTHFFLEVYGSKPEGFGCGYEKPVRPLFDAMVESGLLDAVKQEPSSDSGRRKTKYIPNETTQEYAPQTHQNVSLPEGLATLLGTYSRMNEEDPNIHLRSALEGMMLANKGFLRVMASMKEEFPQEYDRIGGQYLDGLLQK